MDEVPIQCPYCWETVRITLERELAGEMVWDCEVCCRPWSLHIVRTSAEGPPQVTVGRAN